MSFLCKTHVQRNIKEKCRKLGLSQCLTDVIVGDILGSGGLISEDTEEPPKFASYYHVYKLSDIWHHVAAKASRDAGLEDEAETNNVPESGNALLKRWQNFQTTDMSSFVDDVKDLVSKQRNDVKRAFLGIDSSYVVRPEYVEYVRSQSDFFYGDPGKCAFADKPIVDPEFSARSQSLEISF